MLDGLFSAFLSFSDVESLVSLLVDTLSLHVLDLAADVTAEVGFLNAFPLVTIKLGCVESETDLICSELTILSKSVQADHILDLLGGEGLGLDLRPVSRVGHILGVVSLALLSSVFLLLIVFTLLVLLLFLAILDAQSILHTVVVGLNEQARVVLEADGHVRSEAGHLEEMDAGFTHDFLDQNVLKVIRLDRVAVIIDLVVKDIESEATALVQHLVDEETVLLVRVREMDELLSLIDVSHIVISVLDGLLWRHKLADIDSRCIGECLQVISEILEVITQVMGIGNLGLEGSLLVLNSVLLHLALSLLCIELCTSLSVLLLLLLNDSE